MPGLMSWLREMKPDYRRNMHLAWPIMLSQAGQVSVNFVDNIMLGRLGAAPLAAVSLGNALFIIFLVFGLGLSFALTPLVAEAQGADNQGLIKEKFKHSMLVNLVFAILSAVAIILLAPIIKTLSQPEDVVPLSIDYLNIMAYSMIPFMIFQTYRTLSEGLSYTKLVFYVTIVGNVVNIFFNYALIFGELGFPQMGIRGAALGTLIARIIMAGTMIVVYMKWKEVSHFLKGMTKQFKPPVFKRIWGLGFPSALAMLFEVSAFSASAFIIGSIGKEQLAAHQIAINLASITFLLATGFGIVATIRVGNRLGEKKWQLLKRAGYSNMVLVAAFMFVCGTAFILLRYQLAEMYIDDRSIITIAAQLLIIASLFQLVDGVQVVGMGALRGLQDVKVPTMITFVAYWLIALPLGNWLAKSQGFKAVGVWMGLWAGLTCAAILLVLRFRHQTSKLAESGSAST